ncbi:MAG: hypothetical protein HF967_03225 [Methanosarcinales archaeon]|nr:hypothetical protein [Methanosarcinales archaeon]
MKQISKHHEENREISKYISGINLQGDFQTSNIRKILKDFAAKRTNSTFLKKRDNDIIYMDENIAFLYLDKELQISRERRYLLEKSNFILHGRRCFRGHFLNVVELGYCSAYLMKFYNNIANNLFGESQTSAWNNIFTRLFGKPQNLKWIPTLEKIINTHSYIENEHLKKVYACELYKQGIDENFVTEFRNHIEQLKSHLPKQYSIDGILTKLVSLSELISVSKKFFVPCIML